MSNFSCAALMCCRRRLWWNRVARKRHIVIVMHAIPGRVDNRRGDKDQQILFLTVAGLALKQASDEGQVAENRDLILNFSDSFGYHATEHNRLPIPNIASCDHFANAKMGQRKLRHDRDANCAASRRLGLRHKASWIVVLYEFQNGGYQDHLNGIA